MNVSDKITTSINSARVVCKIAILRRDENTFIYYYRQLRTGWSSVDIICEL